MKILLLNQVFYPDPVATAQHTRDLALFLRGKGHEVTVIAGQRNYERRETKYPLLETYQGVRIHRIRSTGFGKRRIRFRMIDALTFQFGVLFKLLTLPRQDIVISFTSPPLIGLLGVLFTSLRGGKSVQWLMDVNPDAAIAVGYLKPRAWFTRILNALFELTLHRSEKLVVLDRWMRDRILEHGARDAQMAIVPPWPVQRLEAPPPGAGENFRKEHGLDGKFVVLYSGNHSVVHPLDTLLEAAIRLKDDPSIAFLFIGGGLRTQDVESAVKAHGLKNIVQLPPQPRSVLPESLGAGHLHVVVMGEKVTGLVHPSKLYGVLATGRPYVYIGPRRSHGADVLQECPYGYHVEHGQIDALCDVIRVARELSQEDREQIARENFGYVTRRYSVERSLGVFYTEVIEALEAAPQAISDEQRSAAVPR
jgi:glycosyltransferase involved in cell wall biosynthesis